MSILRHQKATPFRPFQLPPLVTPPYCVYAKLVYIIERLFIDIMATTTVPRATEKSTSSALTPELLLERRRKWNRRNAAKSRARQTQRISCVAERTEQLLRENRRIVSLLESSGVHLQPGQLESTAKVTQTVEEYSGSKRGAGSSEDSAPVYLPVTAATSGQTVSETGSISILCQSGVRRESYSSEDAEEAALKYGSRTASKKSRQEPSLACTVALPAHESLVVGVASSALQDEDFQLVQAAITCKQHFFITDAQGVDNPILFASHGFWDLTGYSPGELLGRTCRFLQGPQTDPRAIRLLEESVRAGQDIQCCLLSYRKDGRRFWNYQIMSALHGPTGEVLYFLGVGSSIPSAIAKPLLEAQEEQYRARDITGPISPSSTSSSSSSRPSLPAALEQASKEYDPYEDAEIDALIVEHGGARKHSPTDSI